MVIVGDRLVELLNSVVIRSLLFWSASLEETPQRVYRARSATNATDRVAPILRGRASSSVGVNDRACHRVRDVVVRARSVVDALPSAPRGSPFEV